MATSAATPSASAYSDDSEDLDESLPVLKQMNPPEGIGSMTSANIYEVVADVRM